MDYRGYIPSPYITPPNDGRHILTVTDIELVAIRGLLGGLSNEDIQDAINDSDFSRTPEASTNALDTIYEEFWKFPGDLQEAVEAAYSRVIVEAAYARVTA